MTLTRKYEEVKLHLGKFGSTHVMTCRDCSAIISDIEIHDGWHAQQDLIARYIAYIRGDAPFPETESKVEREHAAEESKNAVDETNTAT